MCNEGDCSCHAGFEGKLCEKVSFSVHNLADPLPRKQEPVIAVHKVSEGKYHGHITGHIAVLDNPLHRISAISATSSADLRHLAKGCTIAMSIESASAKSAPNSVINHSAACKNGGGYLRW